VTVLQCFSGQELNPTTDVHELPEKTKIHYWCKLPHVMLRHQVHYIFTCEDLCGISGVDITVGGDLEKGKIKLIGKNHLFLLYSNFLSSF
jgi:hypothetical protein